MPVQTDPYNFSNGGVADAEQVDARFAPLYAMQNGALDDANMAALNKSNVGQWKAVASATGLLDATLTGTILTVFGNGDQPDASGGAQSFPLWVPLYLVAADYSMAGLTTKLRVRAAVSVNGTAPAANFTFGLYPITPGGGAGVLSFTLGAAATTVAVNAPAANATAVATSAEITIPADGAYCFGVTASATPAANTKCIAVASLQTRNV